MQKTFNEEESINDCLNLKTNFISTIKKIICDKTDFFNINYRNELDIRQTSLNDFQGFNKFPNHSTEDDNKSQILKIESSSQNFLNIYFDNKNKNNISIKKGKEEKNELLNKKRKRDKIFYINKVKRKNNKVKFGRKKKTDKEIGIHTHKSKDNIINKIKSHFFRFIRDTIKKNSIYKPVKIIKCQYNFISNLKKDKNENLFNEKIKDILSNQPITTKNKKSHKYENRLIINKIYEEKKETKVIKILELTFKELFIIFRKKFELNEDK